MKLFWVLVFVCVWVVVQFIQLGVLNTYTWSMYNFVNEQFVNECNFVNKQKFVNEIILWMNGFCELDTLYFC